MFQLTVCVLTCNSQRLLREVLAPLQRIADEFVVVDSGSHDQTYAICREFGIEPLHRDYTMHGDQMNYAISHARHDWVLCMDSDEILDEKTVDFILCLKRGATPPLEKAFRLSRYWFVLGEQVRTIYPISSPDFPARLFHREQVRFNLAPVDDAPEGFALTEVIPGFVRHDTFYSIHEVFNKVNSYTTRLIKYKRVRPSLARGVASAFGAFWKWYVFSGAWKKGRVGVVTGTYAVLYSFLKYLKAWYAAKEHAAVKAKQASPAPSAADGESTPQADSVR